ncbi:hypothetical protein B7494_g8488 [Chlorociboria aeruginascens]|nr:hypothetical protein B7494_g8488 [Chlorociboria aeruginascens]
MTLTAAYSLSYDQDIRSHPGRLNNCLELLERSMSFPGSVPMLEHSILYLGLCLFLNDFEETDVNKNTSGDIYSISTQAPIYGHAALVAGVLRCIIEVLTRSVGQDVAKPIDPLDEPIYLASLSYMESNPHLAYTNVASIEATDHSRDINFRRNLYKPMRIVDYHHTLPGTD